MHARSISDLSFWITLDVCVFFETWYTFLFWCGSIWSVAPSMKLFFSEGQDHFVITEIYRWVFSVAAKGAAWPSIAYMG